MTSYQYQLAPDGSRLPDDHMQHASVMDPVAEASLLAALDAPITIHRVFVELCGNLNAAAVLTDLGYLAQDTGDDWISVPQNDWAERLGLSPKEQVTARRLLKDRGFVEEVLTGMPPKLLFRVCWLTIDAAIKAQAKAAVKTRPLPVYS
ncbi:MAG: hypothetical protein EPN74_02025 [Rhodanobacter sp.]|nr:MAG: hypothetical protein EPN74_02025 [Rhodanobacter sp.]